MKFKTHPKSKLPPRTMLEISHRGGFRHGEIKSQEEKDFEYWWRQRVVKILAS
jgi:hypothetical protein